jgi:DNA-binding CsgD family transcriptional regulator
MLLAYGYSYKQCADKLGISITTLKKYCSIIYRKTETRSQGELFARYFAPRLGAPADPVDTGMK